MCTNFGQLIAVHFEGKIGKPLPPGEGRFLSRPCTYSRAHISQLLEALRFIHPSMFSDFKQLARAKFMQVYYWVGSFSRHQEFRGSRQGIGTSGHERAGVKNYHS